MQVGPFLHSLPREQPMGLIVLVVFMCYFDITVSIIHIIHFRAHLLTTIHIFSCGVVCVMCVLCALCVLCMLWPFFCSLCVSKVMVVVIGMSKDGSSSGWHI